MATMYVDNIPEELYQGLKAQAKASRMSLAARVVMLLEENVPTEAELGRRAAFLEKARRFQQAQAPVGAAFPSTEQMLREDRDR